MFIKNNFWFIFDNISISNCFSNYYPIGIYITENNLNKFTTKYNLTNQQKSEIKNSYLSENLGLFDNPATIAGGVIVSTAKLNLIINNTQFINNSFTISHEG